MESEPEVTTRGGQKDRPGGVCFETFNQFRGFRATSVKCSQRQLGQMTVSEETAKNGRQVKEAEECSSI